MIIMKSNTYIKETDRNTYEQKRWSQLEIPFLEWMIHLVFRVLLHTVFRVLLHTLTTVSHVSGQTTSRDRTHVPIPCWPEFYHCAKQP